MSLLARIFGLGGKGTVETAPWRDTDPQRSAVVRQSAALLLGYPDRELLGRIPQIRAALQEVGVDPAPVDRLEQWMLSKPLAEIQGDWVQEYDLSRRHSLHLTYWTDGDTRRRGESLLSFKELYAEHGFRLDDSELPDHLPVVLEFAALVAPDDGAELLQRYRPSLELLRLALKDDGLPHLGIVELVCTTLPGASPEDRDAVMRMAGYGPPTETVGLQPFDPRLLPLSDSSASGMTGGAAGAVPVDPATHPSAAHASAGCTPAHRREAAASTSSRD